MAGEQISLKRSLQVLNSIYGTGGLLGGLLFFTQLVLKNVFTHKKKYRQYDESNQNLTVTIYLKHCNIQLKLYKYFVDTRYMLWV